MSVKKELRKRPGTNISFVCNAPGKMSNVEVTNEDGVGEDYQFGAL